MGLARAGLTLVSSRLLTRLPRRLALNDASTVKANLGSGLEVAPGWLNLDASLNAFLAGAPVALIRMAYRLTGARQYYTEADYITRLRTNDFIHHDLTRGIPLPEATVDFCFSSHFLEHLYPDQATIFLQEVRRVMKPGGVFRVVVPDLGFAVSQYHPGDHQRFLSYFFQPRDRPELSRHRYMYDYESLAAALTKVGFERITRCEYRVGEVPDLETLDNRPDESLYVEAYAPR